MIEQEYIDILNQLKEYQKEATSSKKNALAALFRAGLITKSGKPTKYYRHKNENKQK
jgi:hypothetical protein